MKTKFCWKVSWVYDANPQIVDLAAAAVIQDHQHSPTIMADGTQQHSRWTVIPLSWLTAHVHQPLNLLMAHPNHHCGGVKTETHPWIQSDYKASFPTCGACVITVTHHRNFNGWSRTFGANAPSTMTDRLQFSRIGCMHTSISSFVAYGTPELQYIGNWDPSLRIQWLKSPMFNFSAPTIPCNGVITM